MYTLIRAVSLRRLLLNQGPSLIGAMVIAEVFYKFHSFTLETVAFLATWFALDAITAPLADRWARNSMADRG